jgi:Outer membrane protein beta-barrel domain
MRFIVAVLAGVLFPSWCAAQVSLPRNDATLSFGWSGSEYGLQDYDRWRGSLFVGFNSGRYWTDHFKTDIEAGWHSRSSTETYQEIVIGGAQTYGIASFQVRDLRITIAPTYQFGRNQWVHPYVGAGTDIIHRKSVLDRPAQFRFQSAPVPGRPPVNLTVPALNERKSELLLRPFLKTGVKMYTSERSFFVTELKLGFAPDVDHALWKLGVGFDF